MHSLYVECLQLDVIGFRSETLNVNREMEANRSLNRDMVTGPRKIVSS